MAKLVTPSSIPAFTIGYRVQKPKFEGSLLGHVFYTHLPAITVPTDEFKLGRQALINIVRSAIKQATVNYKVIIDNLIRGVEFRYNVRGLRGLKGSTSRFEISMFPGV